MDIKLQQRFIDLWQKYFNNAELPITCFFSEGDGRAEMLSGLFTLANFDQVDPNGGVMTPFGAGCGTIVHHPWLERGKENPRCIIGMFDPSARPCVPRDVLTFASPFERFVQLVDYMEESFLITDTWDKVKERIE